MSASLTPSALTYLTENNVHLLKIMSEYEAKLPFSRLQSLFHDNSLS